MPHSAATTETERLARLWQQPSRPLRTPPGLEALLTASATLAPAKLEEARCVWAGTRRHLAHDPSDIAAADRLGVLTEAISGVLRAPEDRRALQEGALEVLPLPRHRQAARGRLARLAASRDDVEGARAWLTGCDPRSDDLEMDSAYRVSLAYVATAAHDPAAVIHLLGAHSTAVPIAERMGPLATVLRANALERTGNPGGASIALANLKASDRIAADEIMSAMPADWRVCASSWPAALRHRQEQLAASAGTAGLVAGPILIVTGLLVAGATLAVGTLGPKRHAVGITPFLGLVVLGLMGLGIGALLLAARQRRIVRTSLQGRGRILSVSPTSATLNYVPVWTFVLHGTVQGHPPFTATVSPAMAHDVAVALVGKDVPILWHPKHPTDVLLDLE